MDFLDHAAKVIGIAKDIAVGGAAVWAAWVGVQGLRTWRRQLIGGKRLELAENALVAAHDAVAAIREIRNPFSHSGEGVSRKPQANETAKETENLNSLYVPIERAFERKERFDRLRELQTRCRIHFGDETVPHFDTLMRAPLEIVIAARQRMNASKQLEPESKTEQGRQFARQEQREAVIWDMGTEEKPDAFYGKVKGALAKLDELLKSYIRD